jgi:signal transduction histidine kinase
MRWLLKGIIVLLPAVIGIPLGILFLTRVWPNPFAFIRAQLSTWALLLGILGTLILSAVVLGQHIWETRLRSRVLAESADDRRRFLRRLDHELKNPLTAIRAGLVNLAEAPSTETANEALESVQEQALRLSRLSADLRKLAELETRSLERTPVNFGELLEDAFSLAQEREGSAERRLNLVIPRAPWPLPPVPGDRDLLFLGVHNMIDNAIKFTRPGDTIEVRAFEDGSTLAVEVADTGPGIPADELPHVWEELYRGRQARGIPGSGLGLSLVKAIADRHGGRVTLRSREGQGTVFTLRLPLN